MDDQKLAGRSYSTAVKLHPTEARYRQEYGKWLQYTGKLKESLKELKESVRLDPGSSEGLCSYAQVLKQARDLTAAKKHMTKAWAVDPRGSSQCLSQAAEGRDNWWKT